MYCKPIKILSDIGSIMRPLRANQPTRDRIYQFRTRIPNQTFAGFIASAQESLTLVARKTIPLLMAALSLILTASHSHAGLGWTLAQFKQQYGEPVLNQEQIAGRIGYVFKGGRLHHCCFLS